MDESNYNLRSDPFYLGTLKICDQSNHVYMHFTNGPPHKILQISSLFGSASITMVMYMVAQRLRVKLPQWKNRQSSERNVWVLSSEWKLLLVMHSLRQVDLLEIDGSDSAVHNYLLSWDQTITLQVISANKRSAAQITCEFTWIFVTQFWILSSLSASRVTEGSLD
jgi:hypothetical protein